PGAADESKRETRNKEGRRIEREDDAAARDGDEHAGKRRSNDGRGAPREAEKRVRLLQPFGRGDLGHQPGRGGREEGVCRSVGGEEQSQVPEPRLAAEQ